MNYKTTDVRTPAEYKKAVDAAETLGLEVVKTSFSGTWMANDVDYDEPCWPKDSDVISVGRKYFTVEMDGSEHQIYSDDDDSVLTIYMD